MNDHILAIIVKYEKEFFMNSKFENLVTSLQHKTIRAFKNEALNPKEVKALIDVAQRTATSSGQQAASIIRVTDPAKKLAISKICNQTYVAEAAELWIFLVDQKRNHDIALAKGNESSNADYFYKFIPAFTDAILMAQNVVNAAENLGLGTVYLGSIHNDIPQLIEIMELPQLTFPALGLAFGYANQEPQLKPRMDMNFRLFENTYRKEAYTVDEFSDYDKVMQTYYDLRNANQRVDTFTDQIAKGYKTPSARSNFLEEIQKQGFSK